MAAVQQQRSQAMQQAYTHSASLDDPRAGSIEDTTEPAFIAESPEASAHGDPLPVATLSGKSSEEDDGPDVSSSRGPAASERELLELEWEVQDMEKSIPALGENYSIVDRLGEGTFSSVYKAIDLQHTTFDNDEWMSRGPLDQNRRGVVYVALKKIYVTSSPSRILNELAIMEDLRPAPYISYLITAFRAEDQIIAVMPYSRHSDFRDFHKTLPLCDLKCYFRCLFAALQSVHEAGIMHRDVKPANFLYDPRTGFGTLCDFGLAERVDPADWRGKCHHTCPTAELPHGRAGINRTVDSIHFEPGRALASSSTPAATAASAASGATSIAGTSSTAKMDPPPERVGFLKNDPRHSVRANRAGTRGFRAPEVLFKCQDQTVAIDIWSAGVILLSFLTRKFPVFNSNDDVEALLEISTIFGKKRMEQCALLHNRTFVCNIPSITSGGSAGRITDFVLRLNPSLTDCESSPDPEQYQEDVTNALDFVKVCMHLDCTKRWGAKALLDHPFLLASEEEEALDEDMLDRVEVDEDAHVGAEHHQNTDRRAHEECEQVVQVQRRRPRDPTAASVSPHQQLH